MVLNFALAMVLAAITAYTDATRGKIYNIHTFPIFGVGLVLAIIQGRQNLIISAVIIFGFYYLIYGFPRLISRVAVSFGALPLPKGKSALAGGDVKLATTFALLVGLQPALYGTLIASILMLMFYGIKVWRATGSAMSFAYLAVGKLNHDPVPYAPFLGPCTLAMAILFYYY